VEGIEASLKTGHYTFPGTGLVIFEALRIRRWASTVVAGLQTRARLLFVPVLVSFLLFKRRRLINPPLVGEPPYSPGVRSSLAKYIGE
jgi:hypothetical protein